MNTTMMVLRGLKAPLVLLVLGLPVMLMLLKAGVALPGQAGADLVRYAQVGAAAVTVLALANGIWFAFRLWRWDSGHGPGCRVCGGPLGRVRDGIRGLPDYRRCYACTRNTPEW